MWNPINLILLLTHVVLPSSKGWSTLCWTIFVRIEDKIVHYHSTRLLSSVIISNHTKSFQLKIQFKIIDLYKAYVSQSQAYFHTFTSSYSIELKIREGPTILPIFLWNPLIYLLPSVLPSRPQHLSDWQFNCLCHEWSVKNESDCET